MKKVLTIIILLVAITQTSWAYDFASSYNGKTLFYNITNSSTHTVAVTYQNTSSPRYSNLSGIVVIPSTVTYGGTTYSVTSIGDNAFYSCSSITSVTIPESITSIGAKAFNWCTSLATVNFNATNCTTMQYYSNCPVFYNCTALTTLNIGSNVTTIPERAFYGCSSLTNINLPASISSIGAYAFYECSSITGAIVIPAAMTTISEYAFYSCSSITSVTIPESITSIGAKAFNWCTSLATVNFNATNCTMMQYYSNCPVFYNCTALTTLNIGSNVTTIPERAFYDCSHLTSLNLPASVSSIGAYAFGGCTAITGIHAHRATPPTLNSSNPFLNISSSKPVYVPCGSLDSYYSSWTYFTNISEEFAYTVSASSSNTTRGSVSIVTAPTCTSANAKVQATANTGYQFDHWSNGSTSNPYTFTVTKDTNLIAYFTPINYTITVTSDTPAFGSASGGGVFPYNTQTSITATPNEGCRFTQWNDGNTSNPRTITISGNATYTAYFTNQHTITVLSGNQNMGSASGGGTYAYNTTVTITATPNQGYEFTQWNDGNTSNPRTITITGSATYTAAFSPINYTITVVSGEPTMGDVSGSGSFPYNSQTTIVATPNEHYEFTQWNDGNTSNPRTISIAGNATYTAHFSIQHHTLNVVSNSNTMGTTTGSGTYEYNTMVTIAATPNQGYEFTQWNDGNTSNPRTITVTCDTNFTATFAPIDYQITVLSGNPSMGSVSGSGTFPFNSQTTISATPNYGYQFTHWNDGNTTNPRTITIAGAATYTASFEPLDYTITVNPNNQSWGTTSGSGSYEYNTTATITATPNQGYEFTQWNDGNTSNPRAIIVTRDTNFTATFAPIDYTITVNSDDPQMGSVSGGGTYPYNSQVTITATPNEHYNFIQWNDGNTTRQRSITVTGNATYTAYFAPKNYTINVVSHNNNMGTTTGSGTYEYGASVIISAEPFSGYAFSHWSDNSNASRIRTVTVNGNATYTAYFVESQGIDDISAEELKVYSRGMEIVIEGAENSDGLIYDIMGRIVHKGRIEGPIHVNNMGVYMVKIGDRQPLKVVVR